MSLLKVIQFHFGNIDANLRPPIAYHNGSFLSLKFPPSVLILTKLEKERKKKVTSKWVKVKITYKSNDEQFVYSLPDSRKESGRSSFRIMRKRKTFAQRDGEKEREEK